MRNPTQLNPTDHAMAARMPAFGPRRGGAAARARARRRRHLRRPDRRPVRPITEERSLVRTRRRTHRRRIVAAVLAAMVAPSRARPPRRWPSPPTCTTPAPSPRPTPTPSDFTGKIGDTPADFAQPVAPAPKAGDTKFDSPGASRAPQYDPTHTIQVIRPERTIVRDTDDAPADRAVRRRTARGHRPRRHRPDPGALAAPGLAQHQPDPEGPRLAAGPLTSTTSCIVIGCR